MKIIRKETIILVILLLISLLIGAIYLAKVLPANKQEEEKSERISHSPCLSDDEIAEYLIDDKYAVELKYPKFPLTINVKDKNNNNKIKLTFQINNVRESYHPIELHKCGVYVVRIFNYNPNKTKQDPGYKEELWEYDYNGNGRAILLLAEKPKEFISYYSPDFRIDSSESYLFLIQSYLGQSDYALVVKDLKTKEDVFVLTLEEVLKKYPDIRRGSFGLGVFTPDN